MTERAFTIEECRETLFFGRHQGVLRQWIELTIRNASGEATGATVTISSGGEDVATTLRLEPGVRTYRAHAPVLWPDRAPESEAPICLRVGDRHVGDVVSVGNHRPWTVYLLSDTCTDYAWVYDSEEALRADDAELTEAELVQAEATEGLPEPNRNHYNLVHSREIEFYLERYPDRAERLWEHLRRETITLNPFFNMCLTGNMSLEELIRHFYPARNAAVEHGVPLAYANHQETPTIAWVLATILADCEVRHLVKSILQVECPWASRLEEPPIFVWEGPDGSRIKVRRNNRSYAEGYFVPRGAHRINPNLHERIIPEYEALGADYPFSAIGLVGCYSDLSPRTKSLAADKAQGTIAYNAQPWEFPRLVNASHRQFWDHVERETEERDLSLPVSRGDYGTSWEVWPACLAAHFAGWRRAQRVSGTADALGSVLSRVDPDYFRGTRAMLRQGWRNLTYLADHAWNGSGDGNLELNKSLRRRWQAMANRAFDDFTEAAAHGLAHKIGEVRDGSIAVFNAAGRTRTDVVSVACPEEAPVSIEGIGDGESLPVQVSDDGEGRMLHFVARDLPPVGYRVYAPSDRQLAEGEEVRLEGNRLEGPFYLVEVSPQTGGIVRIYDKAHGRELVDADSPYHFNQCLFYSNDVEHTPRESEVRRGSVGPVFGRIVTVSQLKDMTVRSIVTVYSGIDRIDIRNEVAKRVTTEPQELDFTFPFNVPGHSYRYDAPGVVLDPERDPLPGAGLAVNAVRHFVDVFNDEYGVTLRQVDSGLVQFGHRTSREDPQSPDMDRAAVLVLAMQNCFDKTEAALDQDGVTEFVFRYSLRGHGPGFDPVEAVCFGRDDACDLSVVSLGAGLSGNLPGDLHSFLDVSPGHAVLESLKVAEDEGLIVRLWECAGEDCEAQIGTQGLGRLAGAAQTDLLERDRGPLPVEDGTVRVPLKASGLATVRLLFE